MEIVFALLKQLSGDLSTGEFLFIIVVVVMFSFNISKFFLHRLKKKGWLFEWFGATEVTKLEDLSVEMTSMLETLHAKILELAEQSNESMLTVVSAIELIKETERENSSTLQSIIVDFASLKKDISKISSDVGKELDEIRQDTKISNLRDEHSYDNLKELLQRSVDVVTKLSAQIEKIDDFTKMFLPEVRSNYQELNKEINALSRDVALVERSVLSQINIDNAVKLR
jgi:hypothetical protein